MFGKLNGTHQKLAGIVGRDIRSTGATGAAAPPPPPPLLFYHPNNFASDVRTAKCNK